MKQIYPAIVSVLTDKAFYDKYIAKWMSEQGADDFQKLIEKSKRIESIAFLTEFRGIIGSDYAFQIWRIARAEIVNPEPTIETRLVTIEQLLDAKYVEEINGKKVLCAGLHPTLRKKLGIEIEKLSPVRRDSLMHELRSVRDIENWIKKKEREQKENAEYERLLAARRGGR